jgi:excinuclease ABC subunit C
MKLEHAVQFDPASEAVETMERFPHVPAVFALFPDPGTSPNVAPYLGRTTDLHRRLIRLLGEARQHSRMLNLRGIVRRIEYQVVGSQFEAQWYSYLLNRAYYPELYQQRLRLRPPAVLKVNLNNRFPRCYPTRRVLNDGALYYGPFRSRAAAEKFGAEFLDLFKIRRCHEELRPDPAHPGCIYSQMKMCLAPCFKGCTDEEYHQEVGRVVEFLDTAGHSLIRGLEAEREQASEALEFEVAEKVHARVEKVEQVIRLRPELARNVRDLHAILVQRASTPNTVAFFLYRQGKLHGPGTLSFDENRPSPEPLDEQLHRLLETLAGADTADENAPGWEHLSLLSRWYHSSFREGEIVLLPPQGYIPHARLIRMCRRILAGPAEATTPEVQAPSMASAKVPEKR